MKLSARTKSLMTLVEQKTNELYEAELQLEKQLRIDVMSSIHPHGIGSKVKIKQLGQIGYLYGVYSDNTLTPKFLIGRINVNGEKSKRTYAKYWTLEDLEFLG